MPSASKMWTNLEPEVPVVFVSSPEVHHQETILRFHMGGHEGRSEIFRSFALSPAFDSAEIARQQVIGVPTETDQNHHLIGHPATSFGVALSAQYHAEAASSERLGVDS